MPKPTVIIHDYAGHPFQAELSRYIARRYEASGLRVVHAYCGSTHTPQATLRRLPSDTKNIEFRPISLGTVIKKYDFFSRYQLEKQYAQKLVDLCRAIKPYAVLSGNTPSLAQLALVNWCTRSQVRVITWIQDMYGVAAEKILSKKIPILGRFAGQYLIHLDKLSYKHSSHIVTITPDFEEVLTRYGIDRENITTIGNWAPLSDMPQKPRENTWSQKNCTPGKLRIIYSGTLSIRHNPQLLIHLATALQERGDAELIVVSEGDAANALANQTNLARTLRVLPFQPFSELPDVLSSADVLVAILEADAGVFCVPSKVLSYMCAGRALLTAMPNENLATRIVETSGAGINAEPTDLDGFAEAGVGLIGNHEQRNAMGIKARKYAETEFDINIIGSKFESLLSLTQYQSTIN